MYMAILCCLSLSVHTLGAAPKYLSDHTVTDAGFEPIGRHKRSTSEILSPCFVIDTEAPLTPSDFSAAVKDLLNRVTGLQISSSNIKQYVSTTSIVRFFPTTMF